MSGHDSQGKTRFSLSRITGEPAETGGLPGGGSAKDLAAMAIAVALCRAWEIPDRDALETRFQEMCQGEARRIP